MRRRPRRTSSTGIHHFGSRGSNSGPIYFDELDYAIWRRELARVVRQYGWTLYAWTQMPNHFHLLASMEQVALSEGMQDLNWRYSRRMSVRHDRRAHLFENRFWSEPVEDEDQFLAALSYVDMNPYKSKRRSPPEQWRHGSFRAVAGYEHPPSFLAIGDVLGRFHGDPATAVELYREFTKTGMSRVDQTRSQATFTSVPIVAGAAIRG
jgi:REP element-mobilizing transposase RayT